ncbi:MAG: translocation/assembly module TamB domain-containing protein [Chitinophagaceae bacterium]|nr:translocation/assembly module TamB domain-containing protein [Chitinophagaceae bacterium]
MNTKISIQHVDFSLLNKMHLEGVLIEDQQGDTLLYANDMKVRITDWFIFKKQAELKYVGLDNAIIKFQRKDSVWSQQFLFDYFSSPSTGASKKKAGIQLNLKQLEFNNVTFIKKDIWLGEDMTIKLGKLDLNANNLSFSGNQYEINSLILRDPIVAINSYGKLKPSEIETVEDLGNEIKKAASWNAGNTVFKIGNLKIINGTFKTDKETERAAFDYFDGKHILFTEINGDFKSSNFIGDTIFSNLKLTAKERSGLELKNLSADVKMTPQGMFFNNMDLSLNRSTIRNYFSMTYDDLSDMGDFIHKIKMSAIFEDSYVDSDDIAFFAPTLRTWKKEIKLEGKVKGTVDDISGREMMIQAGNNTLLNGNISMTGLPDINQTFIDFKSNDFRTTYGDAVAIVPALRKVTNPDLRKLQYVDFKGSFTGFIRDFVTFGTIQTNLGTLSTDLNMKLLAGQDPVYSGKIATDNFRLGELLGDKNLGAISMTGTVKGKGFNEKSVNTLVDGTIHFADYSGYRYENITVKGKLEKKLFEGIASLQDKNADLVLNGIIDFNGPAPRFNLIADIKKADFKNLNLTKDSLSFIGKLNFNFTSNSIDNFIGEARITEAEISKGGLKIPFDSLVITSRDIDGGRKLDILSNEFEGSFTGDFSLTDLPNAFTYLLNKYYPAYVAAPKKLPKNQDITFDIKTYYVDDYLQILSPAITGFNNSTLEGNFNLAKNEINVLANVPQVKFKKYNFDNVTLQANGNLSSLAVTGKAYNIQLNDSLNIPMVSFSVDARNDSSIVKIKSGANRTVDTANLNALVLTYNDGVKIEFDPSTFTINSKTWAIDESGELVFRKNTPASGLLLLSEGDQKISLRTEKSAKGNWNDVKINLTKINLGDFGPFFLPKNRLEGLVSGDILVEDPTGDINAYSDNIETKLLRLDNDSLGELKTTLSYQNKTKLLKINGSTLNQENYLGFDANIYIGDAEKAKNNLIAIKAKQYEIKILERFLGNLFSDMQGYLTGDINLSGDFKELTVTGKGKLKDAGLRVNFTQCFYKIKDTEIELTSKKIDLDGIVLTDTVTNNPIYITGGIDHESFKDMFYDLSISTQKPKTVGPENNKPILLLNTTFKDNQQFYGSVKGTGLLQLIGPQSDMSMTINAVASDKDSSNITLPPTSSRESGIADFLVERKYGKEMEEVQYTSNATNIIYDVDITANPMVTVKVILDELTGDEIKGKGTGTLNIRSGSSEPLSLRGRFDIDEGSYLFTFQSFFKKPFELRKGGNNYIEWNGDPYDANIQFDAIYTAERVSYAPLANLLKVNTAASTSRGDVYVVASLTDKLFKPQIKFSLDFPSTSAAATDPELALVIQQLEKNVNELNRQVTYLIVFNSFAPSELADNETGGNSVVNTISGIFLNVINDQINKILGNLLKNDKYNISLNTSIYNRNIIDPNNKTALNLGSNVNFSIGRSFFNNRFIISTGVGFDAAWQQTDVAQSLQLLPDVTLEWLINQSGSLRASFFYRENADYLTATVAGGSGKSTKRFGGSLSYRKDFDKLSDIFKKKKKNPPVEPEPEADVPKKENQDPGN